MGNHSPFGRFQKFPNLPNLQNIPVSRSIGYRIIQPSKEKIKQAPDQFNQMKEDQNLLVQPISQIFQIKILKPPKNPLPDSLTKDLERLQHGQMSLQEFLSHRTEAEGHQFAARITLDQELPLPGTEKYWQPRAWQRGELIFSPTDPQWQPQFLQSSSGVGLEWDWQWIPRSIDLEASMLDLKGSPLTAEMIKEFAEEMEHYQAQPALMILPQSAWDLMVEDQGKHQYQREYLCEPPPSASKSGGETRSTTVHPTFLKSPYESVLPPEQEQMSIWYERMLNTSLGKLKVPKEKLKGSEQQLQTSSLQQSTLKGINAEVERNSRHHLVAMQARIISEIAEEQRRKKEERKQKIERKRKRHVRATWRF